MISRVWEEIHNLGDQCELLLLYRGLLSEPILVGLGEILKGELTLRRLERARFYRIFSVFVEQSQNMLRYSAETMEEGGLPRGIIAISAIQGNFLILCENLIDPQRAEDLRSRLEELRSLPSSELRTRLREEVKRSPAALTNQAGLGLLEIARRASRPIEYALIEAEEDLWRFFMKVYL